MNDNCTSIKVLLYEHNNEANALLRSDYRSLGTALTRYLNYIDEEPLIKSFVDDCVQNHLPAGFDAGAEVDEVKKDYHGIFTFPPDYKGECAVTYLILKNIVERNLSGADSILYPYGNGSKKYDDMASGFLDAVARRLANGVLRAITVEGIKNGMDANVTQVNNFNNSGAAIAAQATDNATVTVSQTNGICGEELDGLINALEASTSELSEGNRATASEAIDGLKAVLAEKDPKPSIIKPLLTVIKGINDGITFGKNATELVAFVSAHVPGLLS